MKKTTLVFLSVLYLVAAASAFAAECPKGSIEVTLPDGTKKVHKWAIECCKKDNECKPCLGNKSFKEWMAGKYPECEKAKCTMEQICPPRYVHPEPTEASKPAVLSPNQKKPA